MAVSSSTIGGVNTWTFSGAVTDAELKTAWAGLIVNQEYVIGRAIYLDNTCDLTQVQGGFFVNINFANTAAFILHASRDKTKTVFRNWNFRQTAGISVANRTLSVQSWNGTTLTQLSGSSTNNDGLDMFAGSFTYAVVGNPGGGDPRYLDEFAFGTLDGGTLITSSAFTEQELQPDIRGSRELKGVVFTRCFGFPQATGNFSRIVMWRCFQNSMHPTQRLVRAYAGANICYIDSTLRRNNAPVANPFIDTFGGAVTNLLVLNNWRDETWFGVSKTTFLAITGWNINSTLRGGILKRLQFVGAGANGTVKVYDSRSTTVPQRSTFVGTANADFLAATTGTQTDSEGKVQIVSIGAIMNSNLSVTRYTGQKFTYQQFGKRVMVTNLDVTAGGDNDLSAYAPIVLTNQEGILRTESAINSATSIDNFQQLLEELHILAIGLSGSQSYSGAFNGNLFNYDGVVLTTSFATVNVDATAASKIAFNSATNTLTIKSSVLMDALDVQRWNNSAGAINLLNGAQIQGIYQTSSGTSTIWEFGNTESPITVGTSLVIYDASGTTKYFNAVTTEGVYRYYIAPQAVGEPYTYAIEKYGTRREEGVFPSNFGDVIGYAPRYSEDVGITETTLATVQAYTTLSDTAQIYDATANFRLSETGIKLGQLVARDGTFLDFGNFNVKIKDDASIISVATGTITYKAIVVNESTKYNAMKATPPKTITVTDNELISVLIEDANGDSQVTILGGDNLGYELWKVTEATATDDYATGTLLTTLATNALPYRFIGISGFDIVGRDVSSGVRRRSSMLKGTYTQAFYVGDQIQLATNAPQLIENNEKLDELILKIDTNLDEKISTRLAEIDYVEPHNAEIDAIKLKVDTLENTDLTGIATATNVSDAQTAIETAIDNIPATDLTGIATSQNVTDAKDEIIAEIGNIDVDLTGVALEATSQSIINKVDAIQTTVDNIDVDFTPVLDAVATKPTLTEIEASTILANKTDIENAKDSIETKIDNIVVDNDAIATEVWNQEPERLKQVATVETTGSQIASFNNL